MNKRDLKRLKIDPSYVISPEKFIEMFGIECSNVKKLSIHDLHYILGKNLNHVGVNQINLEKICTGDIILIGKLNYFKAYYRPIIYKIKVNNKVEEVIESEINNTSLSELCTTYKDSVDSEKLDKCLNEIYDRSKIDLEEELEPKRVKIYTLVNKFR